MVIARRASRLSMGLAGITLAGLVLLSGTVEARSSYISQIPNGGTFSCNNCHPGGNTHSLTGFGSNFLSNGTQWTSALKDMDSDGDGFANYIELQDLNKTWSPGQGNPGSSNLVSNPGDSNSVPPAQPTPTPTPTMTPTPSPTPAPSNDPMVVIQNLTEQHWESASPAYNAPNFVTSGGIGFFVPGNNDITFGFWQTKESLNAPAAGLYKLTANLSIDDQTGTSPEFRLRAFRADNAYASMAITAETGGQTVRNQIEVYFLSDGTTPWRIAFDVVGAGNNFAGGATISSMTLAPATSTLSAAPQSVVLNTNASAQHDYRKHDSHDDDHDSHHRTTVSRDRRHSHDD